ncbi:MAG: aldo/keto reductase, partial [Armatimonadota bacterium]|nr:aldo/keto reductase [Armatimonadota bacterium]
ANNIGVIAKRPIANALWKNSDPHAQPYGPRLQKLAYDFLQTDKDVETALRFTLSQPGVCTAIVGTKNPDRWAQNAQMIAAGPLPQEHIDQIRARWQQVTQPDWVGQG